MSTSEQQQLLRCCQSYGMKPKYRCFSMSLSNGSMEYEAEASVSAPRGKGRYADSLAIVTATGDSKNGARENAARRMLELIRDSHGSSSYTVSTATGGSFVSPQPVLNVVKIYLNDERIWTGSPTEFSKPSLWKFLTKLCNNDTDSRFKGAASRSDSCAVNSSIVSSINFSPEDENLSKSDVSIAAFAIDPDDVCIIQPPVLDMPTLSDPPVEDIGAEVVLGEVSTLNQSQNNLLSHELSRNDANDEFLNSQISSSSAEEFHDANEVNNNGLDACNETKVYEPLPKKFKRKPDVEECCFCGSIVQRHNLSKHKRNHQRCKKIQVSLRKSYKKTLPYKLRK